MLINLLNNSRDAMPAGGKVTISTRFDSTAGEIQLRVKDTGHGMPEDIRGRIFDPFFTTRSPGEGMGLGLPVASGIVRAHHGRLELESSSELGSVFKISLPLSNSDLEEGSEAADGSY